MLHNFKNIRSRDAINETMMQKFSDILHQFERELESINQLFLDNKDDPPISRNQPPVAGAIGWSHSLFYRIKQTVLRFQTMKELIDSEAGRSVRQIVFVIVVISDVVTIIAVKVIVVIVVVVVVI